MRTTNMHERQNRELSDEWETGMKYLTFPSKPVRNRSNEFTEEMSLYPPLHCAIAPGKLDECSPCLRIVKK